MAGAVDLLPADVRALYRSYTRKRRRGEIESATDAERAAYAHYMKIYRSGHQPPESRTRAQQINAARDAATRSVAYAHPEEFDVAFAAEKKARGL